MDEPFNVLKERYDEFQTELLRSGKLLMKDTQIGFWGVTPLRETFELFKLINIGEFESMMDLGSGDGRIVLLASLFGVNSQGIEFDEWLVNKALSIRRQIDLPHFKKTKFLQDNYMDHDISDYGLIFISPDRPFFRKGLERKLLAEMKGRLLVHGWEFHPEHLKKIEEHVLDGEKFILYTK